MTERGLVTLGRHQQRQLVRFLREVHRSLASYLAPPAAATERVNA